MQQENTAWKLEHWETVALAFGLIKPQQQLPLTFVRVVVATRRSEYLLKI